MTVVRHAKFRAVVFDADSTLAAIEGIDWLGELRGSAVGAQITDLTNRAMSGELPLEEVYAARLGIIRPTLAEIDALAAAYIGSVEPGAAELIRDLHDSGMQLHIVSGGLKQALLPLAAALGVSAECVHAVELVHDERGKYVSLADDQPLSRQDGKPRVVRALALPRPSVIVGDGSTDLMVRGDTDLFVAYTAVVRRSAVVAGADFEAHSFAALQSILFTL
ncbi:MAG: HAD-IB family phosphatase [Phycisphaerae bacterium]|nr:HAD-IB family phosphatase [Gemmatimonadaceae bacterium]